jgi:glutamate-1-semialdehyde 2,1-aminomutase
MLESLERPGIYEQLEQTSAQLESELGAIAKEASVPVAYNRVGSMWTSFFSEHPVTDYASAKRADAKRFAKFFLAMLDRGVYLAPSQFEAAFVSTAHDARAIDHTLTAAREAMRAL